MNLLSTKKTTPVTVDQNKHNPFFSLQNELNKAMGDFYGWFEPFNFPTARFENLTLNPAIDLVDDEEQFKVEVEMPGMGEADVNVSIDNGILTIKGKKTTSKQDTDKNYMLREISYGSYERSISLPDTVDVDKAKASFKKGMLWVTLPKKPECTKKCRTIGVEKVD